MVLGGSRRSDGNGAVGRNGRPAGVPISRALEIRPGIANDDLREAVAAINRVHGTGDLPSIPMAMRGVLVNSAGEPVDGLFSADETPDGRYLAQSIQIRSGASHRPLVTLHEIGHFLDLHGLPGSRFASADTKVSPLADWRRAVLQSRAVGVLAAVGQVENPVVRQRAERLIVVEELWARSYAQFVVIRGGTEALRESLRALRRHESGDLSLPRQWDDDDFVDIEIAIDQLFRRLGWIA